MIKLFGFIKNEEEPGIFKKVSGSTIMFLLYVDNILLIENDIPMLTIVKIWLSKKFSMKDIGEAMCLQKGQWERCCLPRIVRE